MKTNTRIGRREFLASAAAWAAPALRGQTRRPNIVWFMPDQWRGQALGSMGDPNAKTPNLDRLAKEGLQFRNTIANSPVCCPARAILMTGQYCHANGMIANDLRLRESHESIAETLGQAGYRTGFVGKWHLDGGPRTPGFVPGGPRRQGFEYWAANQCSHDHFQAVYFRDDPRPRAMAKFEAEGWTDLALEFLEGQKSDKRPFFLMVAPGPPHDPYGAPAQYMSQHDPAKLQLRENYRPGPGIPDRTAIAAYYAACTAVDEQVGRFVKELDASGLGEDTCFFFFSDHGDMLGSQGLRLKRKPHEESIRVPGIVRYPRAVRGGRVENGVFSHVDIPATTLGLCGLPVPRRYQGKNFSATVTGKQSGTQDSALLQIFGPFRGDGTEAGWRGLRTEQYMYARYEDKPYVLYDLRNDPHQLDNLAGKVSARSLEAKLSAQLQARMAQVGDSWSQNWTAPLEDGGRLYKDKTYYRVQDYLAEHPTL